MEVVEEVQTSLKPFAWERKVSVWVDLFSIL